MTESVAVMKVLFILQKSQKIVFIKEMLRKLRLFPTLSTFLAKLVLIETETDS